MRIIEEDMKDEQQMTSEFVLNRQQTNKNLVIYGYLWYAAKLYKR